MAIPEGEVDVKVGGGAGTHTVRFSESQCSRLSLPVGNTDRVTVCAGQQTKHWRVSATSSRSQLNVNDRSPAVSCDINGSEYTVWRFARIN